MCGLVWFHGHALQMAATVRNVGDLIAFTRTLRLLSKVLVILEVIPAQKLLNLAPWS